MAVEARNKMYLRHAPLFIARELARKKDGNDAALLPQIINRADELAEFLALYWKDGKQPLSAQVKKGLAKAFTKFNAYNLAKYNRDNAIKLRDVLFLCHAKPKDEEQAKTWKQLVEGTLPTPDTWEVALSSGEDKKESWERLLSENKLGGLALLRNIRNMEQAGVEEKLIRLSIESNSFDKVLPFRFIAAAKHAPSLEDSIEKAMLNKTGEADKISGKTVILVDVSGSMDRPISEKSDMNRIDAACGLAVVAREIFEDVAIFSFSSNLVRIPARRGFALRDAVYKSQMHTSTYLGAAIKKINSDLEYDRIIVITDEQSQDAVPNTKSKGYLINVATYKNGIGYGKWTHIDGWSEKIFDYIREVEK